ncbi:class I SAM-dependent methyltransferase [Asticcacaulis endophyticus]|uniref:Methyltransferase n=1 Tax=Asticcacaulis endophyticus TaxID=1395890 RepID=A0A918Q3V0_9CAUL|nr:class I SAM-dependent methyltransferase [Asticcacaulis endophyticus]GGZ32842.1 methyltransferase [Asticcacaulis endophyticus]
MTSRECKTLSADAFADTVVTLYQENAAAWIRLRGDNLIERPWLDAFLAALPRDGHDVLDIGCGSGRPIAAYLIENECRLTGVDAAIALIEVAHQTFPDHTWKVADMRNLPPLGRFHGLVAWNSFFHLTPEDQPAMFETFGRLCCPGAALLFNSGTTHGDAIGSFEGYPLYHGSLDKSAYRHLLAANGFEVLSFIEDDPTCGGANVWLAQKKPDSD